jgi:hypothetical protein
VTAGDRFDATVFDLGGTLLGGPGRDFHVG